MQPAPRQWRTQVLKIVQRTNRDVLSILRQAERDTNKRIKAIERRYALHGHISDAVRRHQLYLMRQEIKREQARIWRSVGNVIKARRLEAAARMSQLSSEFDNFLLGTVGHMANAGVIVRALAAAEQAAARSGIDRMIARMNGQSYTTLSQRVYRSEVNIGSQLDRMVNSALARGLSAKEFAAEVADFVNPDTAGGLRYAAMRLARTEINNAAHAMAVNNAVKPWIESMQWSLSASHPKPDVCDDIAEGGPKGDGVYPVAQVPAKPHPMCFCTIVPVSLDRNSFLDALVGGKYDDYLSQYMDIAA